ncbi:chitin deacetylase 8-like [Argiope bruennichi]|uniref:chitin deacetylase 8-like n=1 Tax=Argiope bruennichi TaxID=94029 RepID=UPI002494C93E|nr:chitin deacetylase 8-like [Argiope bruennichi]
MFNDQIYSNEKMAPVRSVIALLFFCCVFKYTEPAPQYDDYVYSDEDQTPVCDESNCKLPQCSCFLAQPKVSVPDRPQFLMITFDDAITVANIETYKKIAAKKVPMTFFVCHEYNDYSLTQKLYNEGHEIAVHSISHESNTDLWRDGNETKWKQETAGMRTMLVTFSGLPHGELVGHRAPFLQTAGDTTFSVLKKERFLYDSSMPSRSYMDPPIWPYTLDHGYGQDCQIEPCPKGNFEGLWEVPMIQYHRWSKEGGDFFCSMLDACTPQPDTAADTKDFLMKNFLRHYKSNKAPFPIFLHEAWLRNNARLQGFLQFLDEVLKNPDVIAATLRDVVEYIRNPTTYREFKPYKHSPPKSCNKVEICNYKELSRFMKSCVMCPKYYPWVGSPLGKVPPKNFPNFESLF